MKKIIIIFLLSGSVVSCYSQKQSSFYSKDTLREIQRCFNTLDSLAKKSKANFIANNGVYCINYLAQISKIEPSSDGTYAGYLYCTKEDLHKWHEWHDKKVSAKKKK